MSQTEVQLIKNNAVVEADIANDAVTRDKINVVSTSSAPGIEIKGDGGSQEGYLQLNCRVNSHGVKIQSPPHSASQSYKIILPDNQIAADKILKVKSITGSGSTATGQLEFGDAAATDFVKLQAASSASAVSDLLFTNLDVTTYRTFKFVLSTYPVTDGAELYLRVLDGNTYKTGANTYRWGQSGTLNTGGNYGASGDDTFAKLGGGAGNNNYEGWRTELTFVPQVSGEPTYENNFGYAITQRFGTTNNYRAETTYFRFNQTDTLDGFEIYTSNGSLGAYSYTLYGLKR